MDENIDLDDNISVCEMIGMDDEERMEVYSIGSEVIFDREEEIPKNNSREKIVKDRDCLPNLLTIGKCFLAGVKYQADWKKRTFINIVNF